MDSNKLKLVVAAVVILLLAGAYFLLQPKGKPDLVVSVAFTPSQPYAGDVVEFNITVSNTGSAEAKDAAVDLSINNISIAQKQVTLAPGESQSVELNWLANSEGPVAFAVNANKGNLIDEQDLSNSVYASSTEILPAENVSLFAQLPDINITKAYRFDATRAGMSQLAGILSASEQNYSQFYASLFNKFGEAHLGILHYSNGTEAAFMYTRAELTAEGTRNVFKTISDEFTGETIQIDKEVAGRQVTVLTTTDVYVTLCLWREKGWSRALMYKRHLPQMQVGNLTIGDPTSCEDLIGKEFNASVAQERLRGIDELASQVSVSEPLLLEARVKPGAEALYSLGFYNDNSAFLLMLSTVFDPVQQSCAGEVIRQDNRTICHTVQASLLDKITTEAFFRKQGSVTIVVFILPFQGTDMASARETALAAVKGVVFQGIPEYDWSGQGQTQIADCRFPSGLWCSPPDTGNATIRLNITHAEGHPIQVNGIRCSQVNDEPAFDISLPSPVSIPANSSAEFKFPCYDTDNKTVTGAIWYLQARLFVNYTDLETNETRMLKGSLVISSPPGGG